MKAPRRWAGKHSPPLDGSSLSYTEPTDPEAFEAVHSDEPVALPDVSKDKLLATYRGRIERGVKWREDEGYDDTWKRLRDVYAGKLYDSLGSEDRAAVNLAFATINVILPSVTVNNPKLTVTARREEEGDQATIAEAAANYYWRIYGFQPHLKSAVKDVLIYGHGWLKCGWRVREKEVVLTDEERNEIAERAFAEADQYAQAYPMEAKELPSDDDIWKSIPHKEKRVVKDCPFVERLSPFDVFVDPEATSLSDAKWVAQRIVRPLEEAKIDKRYNRTARRKLQPDKEVSGIDTPDLERYKDDLKRVTIWEFYDLRRETVSVFASAGDDRFLIDPKPYPYDAGLPFVFIQNYEVPDRFYPIGDLEEIEPIQQELNETRTQLMNHRKSHQRKYLYKREAFDTTGLAALSSDVDNTMVPVTGEDLQGVIVPMPTHVMGGDLYSYSEVITNDLDRVSGVSEYARGGLPELSRTATEAAIIQDAANARAADKLDTIEKAIQEVGRKVIQLAQQFLTADQAISIAGPKGMIWVEFSPDDIQGEFDFTVEAGSTQPNNESFKRQQGLQMLNALGPFIGPPESGAPLNPHEFLRIVLRDSFGYKNPDKFFNEPLPPMPPQGELPPGEEGVPPAEGMPPEGMMPPPFPMEGEGEPPPDIPPEELAALLGARTQLAGQVGLSMPPGV